MKKIKVPFNGKGREISYTVETIDLSMTPIQFLNVYTVFIEDPELVDIVGSHFSILHNHMQTVKPCYELKSSQNFDEVNLKKEIAQQIMNNPTE